MAGVSLSPFDQDADIATGGMEIVVAQLRNLQGTILLRRINLIRLAIIVLKQHHIARHLASREIVCEEIVRTRTLSASAALSGHAPALGRSDATNLYGFAGISATAAPDRAAR